MIQDTAIVTLKLQWELVCNLSSGAISDDLESPVTQILWLCHYLMLNISETVQDRHSYSRIITGTYTCPTRGCDATVVNRSRVICAHNMSRASTVTL